MAVLQDQILSDTLTLQEAQLKDGDVLMAKVRAPQILGCGQCPAFFLVRGDGRVAVWGDASLGLPKRLRNPQQVVACGGALAALVDGEVITWGRYRPPEDVHLKEISQLCATEDVFCALRQDGHVISWGGTDDGALVHQVLGPAVQLAATLRAFLAIAADGRAMTWGSASHGAVLGGQPLPPLRCRAKKVAATGFRFAVLQEDGVVVNWGRGGLQVLAEEVMDLSASEDTFVALRKDGTLLTWRKDRHLKGVEGLLNVTQVVASRYAFAALKRDGTVSVWGHPRFGGDLQGMKLKNVQELFASSAAFAAMRADGSVTTWGDARFGGDGSALARQLADVRRLCRFKRRFFETEE
eukprot:Skav212508  [mRNA]  locus=scaffold2713:92564:93817:+ [translate_table: standard]